ncbi:30516_t:CDS:1, partial [Gigaspora margarita]
TKSFVEESKTYGRIGYENPSVYIMDLGLSTSDMKGINGVILYVAPEV